MKKIVIVRHAKSSWDNPMLLDVDRPLNDRGNSNAKEMAERLQNSGFTPQLIITSHAKRAYQTAEHFANHYHIDPLSIQIDRSLYHGDIEEFVNATLLISDDVNHVMLFGHNPGITYFANVICDANIENVPTCGILAIESNVAKWSDLDISELNLQYFLFPKDGKD